MHGTPPPDSYRLTSAGEKSFTRSLHFRDWETVICRRLAFMANFESQPAQVEMDSLIFHMDGVVDLRWREATGWRTELSYRGGLTLTPREVLLDFMWNYPVSHLFVSFPHAIVQRTAETLRMGDPTKIAFALAINFRDPRIEQLGEALWREMLLGGLGGRVYAQTLGDAFLTHLLRNHAITTPRTDAPHGRKLTAGQMTRIRAYILDNLALDFGVHDLAASIGMSATHFVRCFRRTTGFAPHQYVIWCRVENARILLSTTRLPISQVALLCGFYDQSHLTHHLKRAYGLAPGDMRRP